MNADWAQGFLGALWAGPPGDPDAPAADAQALVEAGEYGPAMARLRLIQRAGLPCKEALTAALDAWPWSIDAAIVACEAGVSGALDTLETRTDAQNRRRAAFAWMAWNMGEGARALASLARIDPASQTALEDKVARAELALMAGEWAQAARLRAELAPALPAPRFKRLEWQALAWIEGTGALSRLPPPRPEETDTALLRFLFRHHMAERDFARAAQALTAMSARAGDRPDDEVAQAGAEFELGRANPQAALALIEAQFDPKAPWTWPVTAHRHWLRASFEQALQVEPAMLEPLIARLQAVRRLHAQDGALAPLEHQIAEVAGDWPALEARLRLSAPRRAAQAWPVARGLSRLGLVAQARAVLNGAEAGPSPDARARLSMARAEMALQGGDLDAAARALTTDTRAAAMGTRAEHALIAAELALWLADARGAQVALAPFLAALPHRPALWMTEARCRFLLADFAGAGAALARFNALKAAQLGLRPARDLRDRITEDAATATLGLPPRALGAAMAATIGASECTGAAGFTPAAIARSPGLAAALLFAARRARTLPPAGQGQAVPRRLWHYWEGPINGAVSRGIAAWAARHPNWDQTVLDRPGAAQWIARNIPALAPAFERQTLPAGRADVLRVGLLAAAGGVWADLDEYPHTDVEPWLQRGGAVMVLESGHSTVANNFVAAPSGHGVFTALAARLSQAPPPAEPYPWWDTGPAPLTAEVARAVFAGESATITLIDQASYCARVATNLPFPHKRGPRHWRR